MSTYNGRRGPNVSRFLRNLDTMSRQDTAEEENTFDDLSMFTTTEFFDLDSAQNTDYRAQPVKIDTAAPTPALSVADDPVSASSVVGDISSSLEFMSGEYMTAVFFPLSSPLPRLCTPLSQQLRIQAARWRDVHATMDMHFL